MQIWIKTALIVAKIASVLPKWWQMIDGRYLQRGFYVDVIVAGRDVVLEYGDYTFRCRFDGTPHGAIEDIKPLWSGKG